MPRRIDARETLSRRKFIFLSGIIPAVMSFRSISTTAFRANETAPGLGKKYPIGLELYSVRDQLARDLPGTLREVARIGYTVVEFYAPYYGWTIPYCKDVRKLMDDSGLRCFSTHNHIESFMPDTMAHAIELNQLLGSKLLILATAPGNTNGVEGWRKLCGQLTLAVERFALHGLAAGFHNHQTEWTTLKGTMRTMDFLAANTPKEFVLQLDVGTCVAAGADPVAWIKANPGRIKVLHLKDWAPGSVDDEKNFRVLFGEGVSPWKDILAAAESVGGVEFYLMEQEGSRFSEFETAKRCFDAWHKLRAI